MTGCGQEYDHTSLGIKKSKTHFVKLLNIIYLTLTRSETIAFGYSYVDIQGERVNPCSKTFLTICAW